MLEEERFDDAEELLQLARRADPDNEDVEGYLAPRRSLRVGPGSCGQDS